LADDWGYALSFDGYWGMDRVRRLEDPTSLEGRLLELAKTHSEKYQVAVLCNRGWPENPPQAIWLRDADGNLVNGEARSLDGAVWNPGMKVKISPEAPDSLWVECGRLRAEPIAELQKRVPIDIVLNGGEFGLGGLGPHGEKALSKCPDIVEAKGDLSWFDYVSQRKAHSEILIADQIRKAAPDHRLYVYYSISGDPHRKRFGHWYIWSMAYKFIQDVSTLPSTQHYHRHYNSGLSGENDMLTMALNAKANEIHYDDPLSYDWYSGGWPRGESDEHDLAPIDRWMGFLKCCYTMGSLGGNAGWYGNASYFEEPCKPDEPSPLFAQLVALSRVHALFSHVEDLVRQSDLLPGPCRHYWSTDRPGYEFPASTDGKTIEPVMRDGQPTLPPGRALRVVARKHRSEPRWLITAWAAAGEARPATVEIPELGRLTLDARPAGSVYLATPGEDGPRLWRLDPDPARPSAAAAERLRAAE